MDIRELIDQQPVDHQEQSTAGKMTGGVDQSQTSTSAQQKKSSPAATPPAATPAPETRVPLERHAADAAVLSHVHAGLQQGPSSSQSAAQTDSAAPPLPGIHTRPAESTQERAIGTSTGSGAEIPSSLSSGNIQEQQRQQHDSDTASISAPSSFSLGLSVDTDESGSDADSALGSVRAQSSSMSASSSIFDFVEEHGRTWHRYHEGKYFMPNDIPEQERLDLQHSISVRLFGGLYLAPIERPGRVLDIGTGTGVWAIEFANEHPESDVLGTDLSPIQPEYVPPNCRFEVDDAEDEWIFSYKFDFIHSRFMSGSISDFPELFAVCLENLNPGGWAEFQDYYVRLQAVDGSLVGTTLERWNECVIEGVRRMGKNALACAKYKSQMQDAGFVQVTEKKFALPGNAWAKGDDQKMLGTMQMENILNGLHGFSIGLFTKMLGMSVEEVELMLVDVRKDLRNTKIHFYYIV